MLILDYKSGRSIHEQITEGIKELIISNVLKENDKLPSVRELSVALTVNPNTVQKAYKELELTGVIYSLQGKGNFVAPIIRADEEKKEKLLEDFEKALRALKFSGVEKDRVINVMEKVYKEENND